MNNLHAVINEYWRARKLVEPMAGGALMLLVAAVGRLAEAYLVRERREVPGGLMNILIEAQHLGQRADQWVDGQVVDGDYSIRLWKRKHRQLSEPNVELSVADCLIMLERFSCKLGIDPIRAVGRKLVDDGFITDLIDVGDVRIQ